MDNEIMLENLQIMSLKIWHKIELSYPKLANFPLPEIKLNNRFTRSLGANTQDARIVELAAKYLLKTENRKIMYFQVLPHELIHQADFDLFGESEFMHGHGEKWCEIMIKYGLPPDRCYLITR